MGWSVITRLIYEVDIASNFQVQKEKGDGALAVLCAFLSTACGFDYCKNKIPNRLIVIMTVAGLLIRWKKEGIGGLCAYVGAVLLIGAFLYPFFRTGGLGAGDVKLLGVTAGYLPFEKIFCFSFVSMLIAAIFSIFQLCRRKCLKETAMVRLSSPALLSVLLLLGGVY